MKFLLYNFILVAFVFVHTSCESQPVDDSAEKKEELSKFAVEGGEHQSIYYGTDEAPYGYYFFTPENVVETNDKFPLLVLLHGYGELGNSMINNSALDRILVNGSV